jgi:hypothetical protein
MGQAVRPDNHRVALVSGSEKRSGGVGDNGVGAGKKGDTEEAGRVASEPGHDTLTVADFEGSGEWGVAGYINLANRRDRPAADNPFEAGSSDVDASQWLGGGATQHEDGERSETKKAATHRWLPSLAREQVISWPGV